PGYACPPPGTRVAVEVGHVFPHVVKWASRPEEPSLWSSAQVIWIGLLTRTRAAPSERSLFVARRSNRRLRGREGRAPASARAPARCRAGRERPSPRARPWL